MRTTAPTLLVAVGVVLCGPVTSWADAPQRSDTFSKAGFDEVVQVLRKHHLQPALRRPHVWAAAANGALAATGARAEVLDAAWRSRVSDGRRRFAGTVEPLICGETKRTDVLVHSVPAMKTWKQQEADTAKAGTTGEPLVDALRGWRAPFGRSGFECVVGRALRLLHSRHPDKEPRANATGRMWQNAATYLLRAIDPHSRLTTPRAWALVNEPTSKVVDLGLTFTWRGGRAEVHEILPHASPQARKVLPGDVLDAVDGTVIRGRKQGVIIGMLQRPAGASVELAFRRAGLAQLVVVQLKYVDTRVKDVQSQEIAGLDNAVMVRIRKFAAASGRQVQALLLERLAEGPLQGVLLDLRGNHGGIIPEAVTLLELFRRGGLIGRVRTRDATAAIAFSRRRRQVLKMPVVMLVDGGCASACEFVAASLQASHRALIVGTQTFGKATLQEYMPLKSVRARVMITVAMFSTPGGLPIQARGIRPDLLLAPLSAKARGEAAMPFHLEPASDRSRDKEHPLLGSVTSCWRAAMAQGSATKDVRLGKGVEALRCLMAVQRAGEHVDRGVQ